MESGTDREDGNGSSADGDKQEQQLDMELVIARNKQSLDWVAKVPLSYRITVYDKVFSLTFARNHERPQ